MTNEPASSLIGLKVVAQSSTQDREHKRRSGPVPRGARRRRQIAAIAEGVFLRHGFTDTKMQMVATEAGASKETLYRHFGSKEELFIEVFENRAEAVRARLEASFESTKSVESVLRAIGINLLVSMGSPEVIALLRIIVSEAPRNPSLGQSFYTLGPERVRLRLAEFFAAAGERGEFFGENSTLLANIFVGAVLAQIPLLYLVRPKQSPMTCLEINQHVDAVVDLFVYRFVRRL